MFIYIIVNIIILCFGNIFLLFLIAKNNKNIFSKHKI
ncbi:hypothetical protein BMW23_0773 [Bodo saltans virus]|uniref:Uncharacterized protein n=1 Tax=Bodo saltans virus TaxID=2024608 RepID=A0A2H4UVC9_9VIRU|nr:hypothetical protein QJ851_gp0756 [Bodo saltans virus]ATZ80819.1 hypothetical protein BMW23_0773 [Bodo saltans virus]